MLIAKIRHFLGRARKTTFGVSEFKVIFWVLVKQFKPKKPPYQVRPGGRRDYFVGK